MNPAPNQKYEIIKKWKQCNSVIDIENGPMPAATRAGLEIAIVQAKSEKTQLQEEYKKLVVQDSMAVFVDGEPSKVNEFLDVIENEFAEEELIVIDANSLYKRLSWPLDFLVSGNLEIGTAQLKDVAFDFEKAMEEAKYTHEIQQFTPQSTRTFANRQELISYVKDLVRERNGVLPNAAYIKLLVAVGAFTVEFDKKTLPVILINVDKEEEEAIRQVFPQNKTSKLTLNLTQKIDENLVIEQFKKISKGTKQ